MKILLIAHRYLGVVVGLLMTLWCLSGFVMMYQGYPAFTRAEKLATLAPIPAAAPVRTPALAPDTVIEAFEIEMLGECPVLRYRTSDGPRQTLDLCSGQPVDKAPEASVRRAAQTYGALTALGAPRTMEHIAVDQWSVGAHSGRGQPLYRFGFDDPAGTTIYVSGSTGEIVQDTTRKERILGWMGAVPHWLYPTVLRQNAPLWTQAVIWSSVIGVFLTATGLYVGIARFKRYRSGRWSPYRGWFYWHHITGLVFGVLTLTWVTSGLMTMSPWGLLDGPSKLQREDYSGSVTWGQLQPLMAALPKIAAAGDVVQVKSAPLAGGVGIIATDRQGQARRFTAQGEPAPLAKADVLRAARALGAPVTSLELIREEDAYYYGHHEQVTLPAYRAVLGDADKTRIYVDSQTGALVRMVDADARANRWFVDGLHSLDYGWLRTRPVWDVVVLLLLAGVTLVCGTGAYMGLRRIGRDAGAIRSAAARPRRRAVFEEG